MGSFYDVNTKKKLHDAKSKIQAITTVYNMELSNLAQSELIYADVLTKYSQLLIMEVMDAGTVQNGMTPKHRNHANQELLRYIKDKYHIDIPKENIDIESKLNKTIKKVSNDFESMKFNTAISALMIMLNVLLRDFPEINSIFVGDFIFNGSIGRCDLPTGNMDTMKNSIENRLKQ